MKSTLRFRFLTALTLTVIATCLIASGARSEDVFTHPAQIRGEVRFGNANAEIVARLSAERSAHFHGNSQPPAPALHFEASRSIPGLPSAVVPVPPFSYDITVEGAAGGAPGYTYSISGLLGAAQYYWLIPKTSPPVGAWDAVTVDFEECPAMLDIRFVDSPGGAPVTVTTADYQVYLTGESSPQAAAYHVPGDGYKLLVRSGSRLRVVLTYTRGSDPMVDRLTYFAEIDIPTALERDEVKRVEVVVPPAGALGRIIGKVDLVGEAEVRHIDGDPHSLTTVMVAEGPPSGEDFALADRYTFLDSMPSSDAFELPNLLASEDFSPTFGVSRYDVYGRMQISSGRAVNFFRIPSLIPAHRPLVPRGGTVDLGEMFVMQPGYVGGQVLLKGPSEDSGFRSPLRYLRRWSDTAVGGAWTLGFHSSIEARGVNTNAPGATETAYQGEGYTEFSGDFNSGTSSLEGSYRLILAGLKSQASVWDLSRLNLAFNSEGTEAPYLVGNLRITNRQPGQVVIEPNRDLKDDLRCCFGSVAVRFVAPAGLKFFRPAVSVVGQYAGIDNWGEAVDYTVETGRGTVLGLGEKVPFLGEPKIQAEAAGEGVVRMFLPRGAYTLTPTVKMVSADGTLSDFSLPALSNIVVGCQDKYEIEQCLAVNIPSLPACANGLSVRIDGTVTSCTNVTKLVWDRGDNLEHVICEDCGVNPTLAFDLPVSGACSNYSFTVTAYDATGRRSSLTKTIPADRIAPLVSCPANIIQECAGPNGAVVNYGAGASDNCGLSYFECSPPSGSFFNIGDTPVECVARDLCGNEARCSFTVTVTTNCPPCLDLQCPQDIVRYACNSNSVPVDYSFFTTNRCNPSDLFSYCYPPSGSSFEMGITTVDCWAFGSGKTNHCSFKVTVLLDPNCQQPCVEIRCPTNLVKSACGTNGVRIDYAVAATNRCNPTNLAVTCVPPSGSVFHTGISTVICTAAGNGQTDQCSFTVTILSDCPPAPCSTNLLVNGSFENPGVPDGYVALPGGDSVIHGWSTLLNGVEYYNPQVAPSFVNTGFAADGVYLVDLAPARGLGGGIQQTLTTVPGRTYRVSFAMGTSKERGRNGTASMTVTVAGIAHAFNVATDQPGIQWTQKAFSFEATSTSSTLVFSTLDDAALSFVNLDDVRVSDCCESSVLKITPTITVEWDCGILQSAPDASGPYVDVPGATSPHTEPMRGPRKFWRTRN